MAIATMYLTSLSFENNILLFNEKMKYILIIKGCFPCLYRKSSMPIDRTEALKTSYVPEEPNINKLLENWREFTRQQDSQRTPWIEISIGRSNSSNFTFPGAINSYNSKRLVKMAVDNNVYCIPRILNTSQISNKVGASSVDSERNMEAVNDPPPL